MDAHFKKWLDMGMGISELAQKSLLQKTIFSPYSKNYLKQKKQGIIAQTQGIGNIYLIALDCLLMWEPYLLKG